MSDEPTGHELHRALIGLRIDIREGNNAINQRLDKLVSAEVHAADIRRVDERIADVLADITQERADRQAVMAEMQQQLQRMTATQRWVAASVVIPVSFFLADFLLLRSGG